MDFLIIDLNTFFSQGVHDKVASLLLGLYYFYRKSSLNRSMLKRSFETIDKRPIMPTRVGVHAGCHQNHYASLKIQ